MECSILFLIVTATTEIYTYEHTLSLHDALPIGWGVGFAGFVGLVRLAPWSPLDRPAVDRVLGIPAVMCDAVLKGDAAPVNALPSWAFGRPSQRLHSYGLGLGLLGVGGEGCESGRGAWRERRGQDG